MMAISRKARIAYNGPAIENGEMDVRDLAPALIAFADLVESVNNVLKGEQKIKVMLNQDSLQRGSFDITFILIRVFSTKFLYLYRLQKQMD